MSGNNHHSGHRERLRNRFIANGDKSLYNHEILEMLLFYPIPRLNTNNIAHELIKRFGSLKNVLTADKNELQSVKGMGKTSASFITFIADVSAHLNEAPADNSPLDSTDRIIDYINRLLSDKEHDLCTIITLDPCMNVKNTLSFPFSDVLGQHTDIRELTRQVLLTDTRNVIVSMYHPSRKPIPDVSDFAVINSIAEAFKPIGINLVDGTVSGQGMTVSLRTQGAFGFI